MTKNEGESLSSQERMGWTTLQKRSEDLKVLRLRMLYEQKENY